MSNKRVNPFKLKLHLLECEADEKDKKISDLEAKLAEKDEQIKRRVAVYEKQFIEQTDEIYKLTQQLAEKEEQLNSIQVGEQFALKCCNEAKELLAVKEKEANQRYKDWQEEIRECDRLRVLLAEKEKEIEYQENMKILAVDNQNKKAIEQLEKVKLLLQSTVNFEHPEYDLVGVYDAINDQINELKGKVEDE